MSLGSLSVSTIGLVVNVKKKLGLQPEGTVSEEPCAVGEQ